jgi:OPA family glycerol-3-phosphate transporter-like MFS transporter/OPA family sugar phosphate sensor protein UhpC-like MFS transporter
VNHETARRFAYWQWRTILATMIGYALFYFVRKNFSIAMATPEMGKELGWTNTQIGLILTSFSLLYGVARFANGVLADRINARYFMVAGLVCAALINLLVGFTSSVVALGVLWVLNAWFQGMGFPPCARLLTHWIHPGELATKMSVWNTSHSVGAALVVVFCSWIISLCSHGAIPASLHLFGQDIALHPGWRWCFYLPAGVALIGALALWIALRDTPSSVGLPELDVAGGLRRAATDHESRAEFKRYLKSHVFGNPTIWVLCAANFFVYTVRFGVLDWGPKLLKNSGGITLGHAAWMVAGFEVAGIIGMLAAGWVTDRFFGGRGPRTCAFCMGLCAFFTLLFLLEWTSAKPDALLSAALLAGAGFFIYGPQALIGISAANLATQKAAATASGLTGTFGYASGLVSGVFLGWLMDAGGDKGVSYVLIALISLAGAGMATFLLAWSARPHGYDEDV